MQTLQLYIQGQRIDLFDDENISLTQTIQNVKDIEKVFTDFSKSFTIPASKTNNKIFKHYYNYDIDLGFDGRKKVDATIELNNLTFKKGKVKLEGVDMRNNEPYAYRITFFGNTVSLKDSLGDSKLSALTWLDNFAVNYNESSVISTIQTPQDITVDTVVYQDAITCPLIFTDNKIDFSTATGNVSNVSYLQLKYAMPLWLIVKGIEESGLGITFTDDSFIKQTNNPQFYNLNMLMHKSEGAIEVTQGETLYNQFTPDFTSMTNAFLYADRLEIDDLGGNDTISYILYINTTTTNDYTVRIKRDGAVFDEVVVEGGGNTILDGELTNSSTGYKIYIEGQGSDQFTAQWSLDYARLNEQHDYLGGTLTLGSDFIFYPTEQLPDITIIDFLSGLFKLFNLTAYETSGKIKVQKLDDFYQAGVTRDISKYVDVNESSVDVALPYKEIKFQYEGLDTYLAKKYTDSQNKGWGTVEYKGGDNFDGDVYEISAPFEHLQFYNIPLDAGGYSEVQFGYMSDQNITTGEAKSYIGSPVLFYPIIQSTSSNSVTIGSTAVTTYTIPSNSVALSATTNDDTCHFSVEINEYNRVSGFNGSLFKNYYENYIQDVFNSKRRLTKVKAHLPVPFLLRYSLADTLQILDRKYIINSINTNLNTGESSLELLNVVSTYGTITTTIQPTTLAPTTTVEPTTTIEPTTTTAPEPTTTIAGTTSTAASISVYARTPLEAVGVTVQYRVNGGAYQNDGSGAVDSSCGLLSTITGLNGGDLVEIRVVGTTTGINYGIVANKTTTCPTTITGATSSYNYGAVAIGANNLALMIDNRPTIYTLSLGYNSTQAASACSDYANNIVSDYYTDGVSLLGTTVFYETSEGLAYSTNIGWYSDGVDAIYWDGTSVNGQVACASQTTAAPTTTDPSIPLDLVPRADGQGWVLSSDACNGTGGLGSTLFLHINKNDSVTVGTIVYEDNFLTTVFDGGFRWYKVDGTTNVVEVDDAGQITGVVDCSTLTTTIAPTTTVQPTTTNGVSCTSYQATNEGESSTTFGYNDCSTGLFQTVTVNPVSSVTVCARTGTFSYDSGDTNYTITNLGSC